MADLLSKIKIGTTTYDIKDAQARTDVATASGAIAQEILDRQSADSTLSTAISTETTRATGAESGLDTRIKALESKGRYLSTWDATTGLPETYPEVSGDYPKTYTYKTGDYYIVNKVAASGSTNYKPDGASITKQDASSAWVVGKAEFTGTLNLGDQFQYDGTNWNYIASATTVAFASIQGDADENTNLKGKLDTLRDGKVDKTQKVAGVDLQDDITTAELQTALGLEDLAYADKATGTYTPAGTISEVDATPAGTVSVSLRDAASATEASLTKADYTPAGNVTGTVTATGTVTLNAFTQTATDITSTGKFTPAGSVALAQDDAGAFQVAGTNASSAVTFTKADDTFVKSLKAGDVDAAGMDSTKFSGGSFTGATQASFTQGSKASFTQGSKAALSTSNISYVESGVEVAVDSGDKEMLVITSLTAKSAKAVDTFTANGDDTFVANGDDTFTANSVGTFTPAAVSAGFVTSQKLPVVDSSAKAITGLTDVTAAAQTFTGKKYAASFTGTEGNLSVDGKYDKATANGATFAGNATGDAITASFAGTEVKGFQVTKVEYTKQAVNTATFEGTTNKITPTFSGTKATIEVEA